MERSGFGYKFLRFIYTQLILRFSCQIRDPYLIRIDKVEPDPCTGELLISYHVANKRVGQTTSVAKFVKTDMIYLVDPRVVFNIGELYGSHSEKIRITPKETASLKKKCIHGIKRVFIDE